MSNAITKILFGSIATVMLAACQAQEMPKSVFIDDLLAHASDHQGEKIKARGVIVGNLTNNSILQITPAEIGVDATLVVDYRGLSDEMKARLMRLWVDPREFYTSAGNLRPQMIRAIEVVGAIDPVSQILFADSISFLAEDRGKTTASIEHRTQ